MGHSGIMTCRDFLVELRFGVRGKRKSKDRAKLEFWCAECGGVGWGVGGGLCHPEGHRH